MYQTKGLLTIVACSQATSSEWQRGARRKAKVRRRAPEEAREVEKTSVHVNVPIKTREGTKSKGEKERI